MGWRGARQTECDSKGSFKMAEDEKIQQNRRMDLTTL